MGDRQESTTGTRYHLDVDRSLVGRCREGRGGFADYKRFCLRFVGDAATVSKGPTGEDQVDLFGRETSREWVAECDVVDLGDLAVLDGDIR